MRKGFSKQARPWSERWATHIQNGEHLSYESLADLQEIHAVYAKHFTEQVICGQDAHEQRQALPDAHAELRATGLASILKHDEIH